MKNHLDEKLSKSLQEFMKECIKIALKSRKYFVSILIKLIKNYIKIFKNYLQKISKTLTNQQKNE